MSRFLVFAQLVLLGLLLVLSRGGAVTPLASLLLAAAGALGIWALTVNRPGNFNVRPEPKPGAVLVTGGPYRWIRHPMYSALVAGGAGLVAAAPGPAIALAWVMLAGVLWQKAIREERGLLATQPGYAEYMQRTRRFVPFLF